MTSPKHPAFGSSHHAGMTIREHYAGLAMQGLLAGGWKINNGSSPNPPMSEMFESYAETSVKMADVLIEALNREPQP